MSAVCEILQCAVQRTHWHCGSQAAAWATLSLLLPSWLPYVSVTIGCPHNCHHTWLPSACNGETPPSMHEPDFQRHEFPVGSAHFLASAGICPASVGLPDFPNLNVNFPQQLPPSVKCQVGSFQLVSLAWYKLGRCSSRSGQKVQTHHWLWALGTIHCRKKDKRQGEAGSSASRLPSGLLPGFVHHFQELPGGSVKEKNAGRNSKKLTNC